ncbi:phosphopantetheine-binding protein [Streptomonospora sediminis]
MRAAVAELLGTEPSAIADDDDLIRLGVDSLGMMRLVNRWRRAGVRVPFRELAAEPNLSAWSVRMDALRDQSGTPGG